MDVMVADTSVLIDLERGHLLEQSFALPFKFKVPDLLYRRMNSRTGRKARHSANTFSDWGCNWLN